VSTIVAPEKHFADYWQRMSAVMARVDWSPVARLGYELLDCWKTGRQVFMAGNGGSAGNAVHLANDFLYAMSKRAGSGLRVHALSANSSVLTCLANDEGYEHLFAAAQRSGATGRCTDRLFGQREFTEHPARAGRGQAYGHA